MWHQAVLAKNVTCVGEVNLEAVFAAAVPHEPQGAFRQPLRPIPQTLGAIILWLRSEAESEDANRD
jgi:hypothetical protein